MRELRGDFDSFMAARRDGTLPLQRLRTLSQNERTKSTPYQTKKKAGKSGFWIDSFIDIEITKVQHLQLQECIFQKYE